MKKQSLMKGSLILGIAGILTRFLGLFFRWPLIMLIGDEGVGYYQMSYPLYMFFVAMASGVPIAMSKLISENNSVNKRYDNYLVLKEAMLLMGIIGVGTSFILIFGANTIIKFLKWDKKAYYSLIGIGLAPAIISVTTVYRGFFQGYQNMTNTAISQVLEQLGRIIFGVGLAFLFLSYGIEYSAGGAAFGATAGGIISSVFLYLRYKKMKKQENIKKVKTDVKILDKILKISIPISVGTTVGTIMTLIDSIMVPKKLLEAGFSNTQSTILFSQLTGKAAVIINVPLTLSMALCTSLIPIIAEVYYLKNKKETERKINLAIKLSAVIAIPCLFGLFFMAKPILQFIFPNKYEGYNILKYLALTVPFIVITQITTSILQSVGHYIYPVINLLIGCVIKVLITSSLVKISWLNIYGAVVASIVAYVVISILNIVVLKRKLEITMKLYDNFIKPTYFSCFMIIAVILLYNYVYSTFRSNGLAVLISIFIGGIIYLGCILAFKVFSIDEVMDRIKRKG